MLIHVWIVCGCFREFIVMAMKTQQQSPSFTTAMAQLAQLAQPKLCPL